VIDWFSRKKKLFFRRKSPKMVIITLTPGRPPTEMWQVITAKRISSGTFKTTWTLIIGTKGLRKLIQKNLTQPTTWNLQLQRQRCNEWEEDLFLFLKRVVKIYSAGAVTHGRRIGSWPHKILRNLIQQKLKLTTSKKCLWLNST
jgi:hypothetical protein